MPGGLGVVVTTLKLGGGDDVARSPEGDHEAQEEFRRAVIDGKTPGSRRGE